eukprot:3716207-Prymnesium_polylepis.1
MRAAALAQAQREQEEAKKQRTKKRVTWSPQLTDAPRRGAHCEAVDVAVDTPPCVSGARAPLAQLRVTANAPAVQSGDARPKRKRLTVFQELAPDGECPNDS